MGARGWAGAGAAAAAAAGPGGGRRRRRCSVAEGGGGRAGERRRAGPGRAQPSRAALGRAGQSRRGAMPQVGGNRGRTGGRRPVPAPLQGAAGSARVGPRGAAQVGPGRCRAPAALPGLPRDPPPGGCGVPAGRCGSPGAGVSFTERAGSAAERGPGGRGAPGGAVPGACPAPVVPRAPGLSRQGWEMLPAPNNVRLSARLGFSGGFPSFFRSSCLAGEAAE